MVHLADCRFASDVLGTGDLAWSSCMDLGSSISVFISPAPSFLGCGFQKDIL